MTDWRPIDTCPKDGTPFLVWDGAEPVCAHWGTPSRWLRPHLIVHQYDYEGGEATHWTPMLEAPAVTPPSHRPQRRRG